MSIALCVAIVCSLCFLPLIPLYYSDCMTYGLSYIVLTGSLIQNGSTALRVASALGQTDVVHLLLTRGATVDIHDKVRLNL